MQSNEMPLYVRGRKKDENDLKIENVARTFRRSAGRQNTYASWANKTEPKTDTNTALQTSMKSYQNLHIN